MILRDRHHRRTLTVIATATSASVAVVVATLWWLGHSIGVPVFLHPGKPLQQVDPYCGAVPAAGFDNPPNRAYAGDYVNATYGYGVTIPTGLTGFTPYPGPQKGFGIVLSWTPRAVLRTDAIYDVYYDISAAGVHLRDVVGVKLFDRLLGDQSQPAALADTPGGRYRMRVQCGSNPQVYIHEGVIVVRNREIYRLDLQTVPQRYAHDVRLLDAMLRTWRWVPLAPTLPTPSTASSRAAQPAIHVRSATEAPAVPQ